MNEPRREALAAAQWWTDRLAHAETPESLAYRGREYRRRPPEQLDAFRRALSVEIESILTAGGRQKIEVDYDPDATLCRAAQAAGFSFDLSEMPRKTLMRFLPEGIDVSQGYGQPFVAIGSEAGGTP